MSLSLSHLHHSTSNAGISLKTPTEHHQQKERGKIERYKCRTRGREGGQRDKGETFWHLLKYFSSSSVMNKVTFTASPLYLGCLAHLHSPIHLFIHPFGHLSISPSIYALLLQLRDPKRQRSHEVIATGQVPVPHLHRQTAVLVVLLQVADRDTDMLTLC